MQAKHVVTLILCKRAPTPSLKALLAGMRKYKRSEISMDEDAEKLSVRIIATDLTALRASFNTVTRDLTVIEKSLQV